MDAGDFIHSDPTVNISKGAAATAEADFPILAANINHDGKPAFDGTKDFEIENGVKFGFFGLDTLEASTKINSAKIEGVSFLAGEEVFQCAQKQVDAFKKGAGICLAK